MPRQTRALATHAVSGAYAGIDAGKAEGDSVTRARAWQGCLHFVDNYFISLEIRFDRENRNID
jgi:hypothetical protein